MMSDRNSVRAICSAPSPDEVRAQVEKINASPHVSRSRVLVRFLQFVAEEVLAGRSAEIKESTIAVEVLAKKPGEHFTREDPVVRVHANRLRKKLKAYYLTDGRSDRVVITIPVGSYVPVFELRPESQRTNGCEQPSFVRRRKLWVGIAAALTVAIAAYVAIDILGQTAPVKMLTSEALTRDEGWTGHPSVSADGRWLAYASDRQTQAGTDIWIEDLIERGPPLRLSSHPARDDSPDLSADGSRVTFRSWRDGGGIYVVARDSREERRIADGGYSPRFSPDGRWIAYVAAGHDDRARVLVVPSEGGTAKEASTNSKTPRCPSWTPDGRHLIYSDFIERGKTARDWFVAPVGANSGARQLPWRAGLADLAMPKVGTLDYGCIAGWIENRALTYLTGFRTVEMAVDRWVAKRMEPVVGMANNSAGGALARPSSGSRFLVYSIDEMVTHLWSLPIRSRNGGLERVADIAVPTGLHGAHQRLSPDYRFLVFAGGIREGSEFQLWRMDLIAGQLRRLPTVANAIVSPLAASDGRVVFQTPADVGESRMWVSSDAGVRPICEACGEPVAWLEDGKQFFSVTGGALLLVDVDTGARQTVWNHSQLKLQDVTLSPDGKWAILAVTSTKRTGSRAFLTPFPGGVLHESRWVLVTEQEQDASLAWSHDGSEIYYFDSSDSYRCLSSRRLRRDGTLDDAVSVRHFHHYQRFPLSGSRIAVTANRIIVSLTTRKANLWKASLVP